SVTVCQTRLQYLAGALPFSLHDALPILYNVRFEPGTHPLELPVVDAAIQDAQAVLGKTGRLLIRKSGTEPVVRVMGEGEDPELVKQVVEGLARCIEEASRPAA